MKKIYVLLFIVFFYFCLSLARAELNDYELDMSIEENKIEENNIEGNVINTTTKYEKTLASTKMSVNELNASQSNLSNINNDEGAIVPLPLNENLSDESLSEAEIKGKNLIEKDKKKINNRKKENEKLISLDFDKTELSVVLRAFAEFSGINIIASEQVKGKVSLQLKNVPWRRAFDTLLNVQGLTMQRHGNVIWVIPTNELLTRAKQRYEAHAKQSDLEPLDSQLFELKYQRAEEVQRLITGSGAQRLLSKRGAAVADAHTNQLFVTDLNQRLKQIQHMLFQIDRPARQVLIEARIVEAEEGFSRNLGVRLGFSGGKTPRFSGGLDNNLSDAKNSEGGSTGLFNAGGALYTLPSGPIAGFPAAGAALTLFRAGAGRLLTLELSALEADGKGKVLSSPRVVTADRIKAIIEQGTELPYQAKIRNGVSGVQFRKAGLRLEVTPHITPDHKVTLDVDVSKDSVGAETAAGPAINTKHVRTRVAVEDGGTVAIGGIFARDERTDIVRVPFLGKLPFIGALFRRTSTSDRKSELIVFITPSVVNSALSGKESFALSEQENSKKMMLDKPL